AANADDVVRIRSEAAGAEVHVRLTELSPPAETSWTSYVLGPLWVLRQSGIATAGADVWIDSNVPFGGGLSSSAAVEVALIGLGAALAGRQLAPMEVARLARQAENDFCHVPCGAMDQVASACGAAGHALLLDCRSLAIEPVAVPPSWAMVVADSGVRHAL